MKDDSRLTTGAKYFLEYCKKQGLSENTISVKKSCLSYIIEKAKEGNFDLRLSDVSDESLDFINPTEHSSPEKLELTRKQFIKYLQHIFHNGPELTINPRQSKKNNTLGLTTKTETKKEAKAKKHNRSIKNGILVINHTKKIAYFKSKKTLSRVKFKDIKHII